MSHLELTDDVLSVVVDPDHGADILSLVWSASQLELLARSPWHDSAARQLRNPTPRWYATSEEAWLSTYRGGWQVLFPNAGPQSTQAGVAQGFHGEAALAPWHVVDADGTRVALTLELFTAPLRISRVLEVRDGRLLISDDVENLSDVDVLYDYVQHPALSSQFLSPGSRIDTGASTFVAADGQASVIAGRYRWPYCATSRGQADLSLIGDEPAARFGWLADFDGHWYAIRNPSANLTLAVAWSGAPLDYAWYWQEFNATVGFPWFRRTRTMAIEPASTGAGGTDRRRTVIAPRAACRFELVMRVVPGTAAVAAVSLGGDILPR